jgi:hypothetical protein
MSHSITLQDPLALDDLITYVGRAVRVDDGSARLIGAGGVLAAYVGVFYPSGILDDSPTVLGLRTFALPENESLDVVVPVAALLDRLRSGRGEGASGAIQARGQLDATAPVTVALPATGKTASWAAISPPRGGWSPLAPASAAALDASARAGIDEIATAIPTGTGEQIVHKVRSQVWGRPIPGFEHIPAGAGFAALSLGFLGEDDEVGVFETGPWMRLTTRRGHVLTKRRSSLLGR